MLDLTAVYALRGLPRDEYAEKFEAVASKSFNVAQRADLKLAGVRQAVSTYLSRGAEDAETEVRLYAAAQELLSPAQRSMVPLKRIEMNSRLRDISNGMERPTIGDALPAYPDAKKGEMTIWTFPNVRYLEEKTHKHYEGRSAGVSVRVAKGVSIRTGQFRGHLVEQNTLDPVDRGSLTITTQRLHFAGAHKAFKLFYTKLALIEPHADGLKIIRDSPTARPQVFMFDDGWFVNEVFQRLR